MLLFCNQRSRELGERVAKDIGTEIGEIERKRFPDGEMYIRVGERVKGEDVVLVHTTKDNNDLVELILTLSALRENGAERIVCVIPYMLYQRQDTVFLEGEAISAKAVLMMINEFADNIAVVNAHFLERGGRFKFGGVEVENMNAFPLLGGYYKGVENAVVFSPDEGSMHYARSAAEVIGCEYDHLVKKRIDGETVEIQPKKLDINGKNAIILDDIISTGGTMKRAAEELIKQGAKSVHIGCVHGVFAKGVDMFSGMDIVCSDTLPTPFSCVSVAPLVVDLVEREGI